MIRKRITDLEEADSFWPSFTDLLTTIILVILLFLVFNLFLRQSQLTKLEEQEAELSYYQGEIEELMGIRAEIAEEISTAFAESDLDIAVDQQTGAIRFSGNVLFEFDSNEIREEFKEKLQEFIPKYMGIILAPEYREHIAEIVIEGHTDDVGSYMYNLELSQERAYSVSRYILSDEFPSYPEQEILKELITANGRSKSRLIKNQSGQINREKSRRVEFKFRLRDEELMEDMLEIIKQS